MNWSEVTIETAKPMLDILCAMLTDIGFKGFSVYDPDDFEDLMAGRVGHWDYLEEGLTEQLTQGNPSVTVYIPENAQGAEQMTAMKSLLAQLKSGPQAAEFGSLHVTMKGIREEDWANNWKQYFKPLPIGERLWITPTWVDEPVPAGRTALRIDPGSSFGTGQHDTTKLCLTFLEQCVTDGAKVLDIGCGSGILSIGAMLLGAQSSILSRMRQRRRQRMRHGTALTLQTMRRSAATSSRMKRWSSASARDMMLSVRILSRIF